MRLCTQIKYISCSLWSFGSYSSVCRRPYLFISRDKPTGVTCPQTSTCNLATIREAGFYHPIASRFYQTTSAMASNGTQNKINFQEHDVFGFDLDHTIAKYNLVALFNLAYECVTSFLVNEKGYDSSIKDDLHEYKDFICKGLFLDISKGNILKIAHDGTILRATHGTQLLSETQVQEVYGKEKKWEHTAVVKKMMRNGSPKFWFFENYFDCPGLVAMARIIDLVDRRAQSVEEKEAQYNKAWEDTLQSIHHLYDPSQFAVADVRYIWEGGLLQYGQEGCHKVCGGGVAAGKGVYFSTVMKDATKFVEECSADIRQWLKSLRQEGKIVFLLTSSQIDYASCLLEVCLGKDWQSYFDISLFRGRKPAFFTDNNPFYTLEGNKEGAEVSELQRHGCYSQGNIDDFNKFLSKELHKDNLKVAYFGDNICSDTFPSKHFAQWDTVLILEEMDAEGYVCSDDTVPGHQDNRALEPGSKRRKVMEHSSLVTQEEMDYLLTDLWGPFLVHRDKDDKGSRDGGRQATFWGDVVVQYSDITVPSLEYLAGVPLDHSFECFTRNGTNTAGYHPGPPSSLLP